MATAVLAVRIDNTNPDHHLWRNNGTWWCHFTIHHPDHTKQRVRRSLNTGDASEARRRRDHVLAAIQRGIPAAHQGPLEKFP